MTNTSQSTRKRALHKFENVDIIGFLKRIMEINTQNYQSDFFDYDKNTIHRAAQGDNQQDKYLLFISRPNGTYCFHIRDLFIKNTNPYVTYEYYAEQEPTNILAYAFEIENEENGIAKGNLYELDFAEYFEEIKKNAVEIGKRIVDFTKSPVTEYLPNDEDKLSSVLEKEYRSYKKLKTGDISKHIADLTKAVVKRTIAEMTEDEKAAHIESVEMCLDFGDTDVLTQFDIALYDALTAERAK